MEKVRSEQNGKTQGRKYPIGDCKNKDYIFPKARASSSRDIRCYKAALFERKPYIIVVLILGLCPWSVPLVCAPSLFPLSLPLVSAPDSAARDCHCPKIKSSGEIISISDYTSVNITVQIYGLILWIGVCVYKYYYVDCISSKG
jgi:hypothetical protein